MCFDQLSNSRFYRKLLSFNQASTRLDIYYLILHYAVDPTLIALNYAYVFKLTKAVPEIAGIVDLRDLPTVIQVLIGLFLLDFASYWIHRLYHHSPRLWGIHYLHHSAKKVSLLTAFRIHPVSLIPNRIFMGLLPLTFASSSEAAVWIVYAYFFWTAITHLPFDKRMGFLRHLIVTPRYHRTHHIQDKNHGNFAFMFPVIDSIFGTQIKDDLIEISNFGVIGDHPRTFWEHLWFPLGTLFESRRTN